MIAASKQRKRLKSARKPSNSEVELAALLKRADEMLSRDIQFIDNDQFQHRTAKRQILGEPMDLEFVPEIHSSGAAKLPSHLARLCDAPLLENQEEKDLFCRMNYLLFRAHHLRTKLPVRRPNKEKLDEIDDLLQQANAVKNRIVGANVRLVVSIVKQLAPSPLIFEEMFSDGLLAMIRAAEKFDFDRGFRFSTYATMVIRRQLYRSMKNDHRDRTRFPTGDPTLLVETPQEELDPRIGYKGWVQLNRSLTSMMTELDDRERHIIRARFGFDSDGKKQTLQSLAKEFGVCKERVRQLEKRAMTKLRTVATDYELESLLSPELHQ